MKGELFQYSHKNYNFFLHIKFSVREMCYNQKHERSSSSIMIMRFEKDNDDCARQKEWYYLQDKI